MQKIVLGACVVYRIFMFAFEETRQTTPLHPRPEHIVIVDDNERFLSLCKKWLMAVGFQNIQCLRDGGPLMEDSDLVHSMDFLLIDIHLEDEKDGLELLRRVRQKGYRGLAVVISGDSSMHQCFRAVRAGANDFLLKRPRVNLAEEITDLLIRSVESREVLSAPALSDLGYLRSFGLTGKEIAMLEEYVVDYCSQQELALRIDKAESHVRKTFSRIYKKLQIDGLGQLVHVLTNCSMFSSKS